MEGRQRRRLNKTALTAWGVWGGIFALWGIYSAALVADHQRVNTAAEAVFIALFILTAAVGVAHVCTHVMTREHERTRDLVAKEYADTRAVIDKLPPWIAAFMAQKINEAIATRGTRTVWQTTYTPTQDLDAGNAAMFMEMMERTGDVAKYRQWGGNR